MSDRILWYLHDHGRGHLERARAVIPRLAAPVVVAAGPGIAAAARDVLDVPVVALPSDVPIGPVPTIGPWHHAPSDIAVRRRGRALAEVIGRHGCTTAVADVSVEVTVLSRLLGLRVVTVRQSGRRHDDAHRIGLATADAVLVPQHRDLEPIDTDVDDRWNFTGSFSRFDGRRGVARPALPGGDGRRRQVVLIIGSGGTSLDVASWRGAAAPAGWQVTIIGTDERGCGRDVRIVGRQVDVWPWLTGADVVVTSAGWAAVADTVAAGPRLVVVAEDRPFDEQLVRGGALAAARLAVCRRSWPSPYDLGDVLSAAEALDPSRWATYHDGGGAARAARAIDRVHTDRAGGHRP